MSKNGLVLEGGALRGMFSVGIMDVMMEAGIRFDGIIGVSAGAAFGCNYKSGQIGRALRYNKKYCRDPRYCSLRSWLKTGDLFGSDFCYHLVPEKLDPFDNDAFARNPAEFWLVCTDVTNGEAIYHRCDQITPDAFEWIRASSSMPLAAKIVSVGGGRYLDGALADSIPLRFFQKNGYGKNVVILTQPAGFIKKPSSATFLMKIFLRKYPALLQTIMKRHEMYNETVRYIEAEAAKGNVLLLRPEKTLPIKRICKDPDRMQQTYDIGRETGMKHLAGIREFLKG